MNDKKLFIVIPIVIIAVVISIVNYDNSTYRSESEAIDKPNSIETEKTKDPVSQKEEEKKQPEEEKTKEKETEKEKKLEETPKKEENKPSPSQNTNQNNNTTKPSPVITYVCPSGFVLEDQVCVNRTTPNYVCPDGTTSFSDENTPPDKYCINLSEGYTTDSECPAGQGMVKVIHLGEPDEYKCFPLHEKIYTCGQGFTLIDGSCIQTTEPIEKQS